MLKAFGYSQTKSDFFFSRRPTIVYHTCETCSNLPSYTSTMGLFSKFALFNCCLPCAHRGNWKCICTYVNWLRSMVCSKFFLTLETHVLLDSIIPWPLVVADFFLFEARVNVVDYYGNWIQVSTEYRIEQSIC